MPLIDVIDDDNSNNEQSMDSLQDILNASRPSLRIPKAFQETDQDVKTEPAALDAWMEASYVSMKRIYSAVRVSDKTTVDGQLVPLIELIVPLTGVRPWVKPEARELAQNILLLLPSPPQTQIRDVLLQVVKPAFHKAVPNKGLNEETGTRSNRSTGLDSGYHADEDDIWKENPGLVDIILWCLDTLHEQDWENLWPLVIPPILTYMDDWQASYRLHGIDICRLLVSKAPSSLLTRTGIDQLMRSSLETSLLRYGDSLSPSLFKEAMYASLELTMKTTKPDSPERFQHLFALLGDSIIGGAWMYGYREALLIQATYEVLPMLLDALGVAFVRYLKAIIPQLLHTLVPTTEAKTSEGMQEASLRTLQKVVRTGAPRMAYWSGEIISGLMKYWISLDDEQKSGMTGNLLVEVLQNLKGACPESFREHMLALKVLDAEELAPLIRIAE